MSSSSSSSSSASKKEPITQKSLETFFEEYHRKLGEQVCLLAEQDSLDLLEVLIKGAIEEISNIFNFTRDDTKETALHLACSHDSPALVQCLLDNGCDPSKLNSRGKSALHVAAEKDFYDVVKLLLNYDCETAETKDSENNLPVDVAGPSSRFLIGCYMTLGADLSYHCNDMKNENEINLDYQEVSNDECSIFVIWHYVVLQAVYTRQFHSNWEYKESWVIGSSSREKGAFSKLEDIEEFKIPHPFEDDSSLAEETKHLSFLLKGCNVPSDVKGAELAQFDESNHWTDWFQVEMLYHDTHPKELDNIQKYGLVPTIPGQPYDGILVTERVPCVFFFANHSWKNGRNSKTVYPQDSEENISTRCLVHPSILNDCKFVGIRVSSVGSGRFTVVIAAIPSEYQDEYESLNDMVPHCDFPFQVDEWFRGNENGQYEHREKTKPNFGENGWVFHNPATNVYIAYVCGPKGAHFRNQCKTVQVEDFKDVYHI